MIEVRDASAPQKAKAFEVRNSGGVHAAKIAQVRDASGVAKTFWQAMTASAAPSSVSGAANVNGTVTVVTNSTSATPAGGTGPYTYLWSGGSAGWSIGSPNNATTSFARSGLGPDDSDTTTFTCTVTDATGVTATTNSVEAFAQNVSYL